MLTTTKNTVKEDNFLQKNSRKQNIENLTQCQTAGLEIENASKGPSIKYTHTEGGFFLCTLCAT